MGGIVAMSIAARAVRSALVAALVGTLLCLATATPALAGCFQVGLIVTCSGASPAGFTAAQDGLSATVQSGATVGTGLVFNNNNQIFNFGTVTVGGGFTAIASGNNNQIMNSGSIVAGDAGTGALIGGAGSIFNSGTVTIGTGGSVGLSAPNVTNAGFIGGGDFSTGINGSADFGLLINRGSILVGDDGFGITSSSNFLTIQNSGSIGFGGCGIGIAAFGSGTTIVNSGTLFQTGCTGGGTGISAGNSDTVINSGTITVGDSGIGIFSGTGTMVTNSGRIVAGMDGIGIQANGNVLNTGTIIVGDGFGISAGIVTTTDGTRITNAGTIVGGFGATGIGTVGNNGFLINTGMITIGRSGFAILGQGDNITSSNSGTISVGRQSTGIGTIGNNAVIANTGTIVTGNDGTGIGNNGNGGIISNSGTIVSGTNGLGMVVQGNNGQLMNSGSITTGSNGVGIGSSGNNAIILNSGTVTVGSCGTGIDTSGGSGSQITNSGRITATGCAAAGVALGTGDTLVNSGTITGSALGGGAGGAIVSTGGGNTIINSGTLDGPIVLNAAGGNSLTNSGLITVSAPLAQTGGVLHTIDGVFTQTALGMLALRVGPSTTAGAYDGLTTGTANLGGTLRATVQPGLYGSTTTYPGIVAFTTSTGSFASVQSTSVFLTPSAIYNAGTVDLVLTRIPFNQFPTGGGNARAIGNVLEANYSTSLTGQLATFYGNLLASSSPTTLSQLTGEVSTAAQNASFAVFGQYLNAVFNQTDASRNLSPGSAQAAGGRQTAALHTTTAGGGTRIGLPESDACGADFCDAGAGTGHAWTYWAQGFGAVSRFDANPTFGSSQVDMTSGGGATGVDVQLDRNYLVGLTLGAATSSFTLANAASSGTSNAVVFGVYGGYTSGPAYVDAALAYGYGSFATQRFVGTGTISEQDNGSFDGSQYGGQVEGGWRFAVDNHTVTPFARLAVQALRQNGYTETARDTVTGAPGSTGLIVQPQTTVSVRSTIGGQFSTSLRAGDDAAVLTPRVRLAWAHEFDTERTSTSALSLLPGATFTVNGAPPAADALVLGIGFDLDINKAVRLFAQFDGDFAANARSYGGTGGVRLFW